MEYSSILKQDISEAAGKTGSITVPTGDEMSIAYHCPASGSGSSHAMLKKTMLQSHQQ